MNISDQGTRIIHHGDTEENAIIGGFLFRRQDAKHRQEVI